MEHGTFSILSQSGNKFSHNRCFWEITFVQKTDQRHGVLTDFLTKHLPKFRFWANFSSVLFKPGLQKFGAIKCGQNQTSKYAYVWDKISKSFGRLILVWHLFVAFWCCNHFVWNYVSFGWLSFLFVSFFKSYLAPFWQCSLQALHLHTFLKFPLQLVCWLFVSSRFLSLNSFTAYIQLIYYIICSSNSSSSFNILPRKLLAVSKASYIVLLNFFYTLNCVLTLSTTRRAASIFTRISLVKLLCLVCLL